MDMMWCGQNVDMEDVTWNVRNAYSMRGNELNCVLCVSGRVYVEADATCRFGKCKCAAC